jgi:DNA-binding NarL/FixJ family response regulator
MQLIRVGIVEDNNPFRKSLEDIISHSPYELAFSLANANSIQETWRLSPCDVLLLDIRLPGLSGLEALRMLRQDFPDLKILMQTVMEDDDTILKAICYGASGYLLKIATAEEYMTAVHDAYYGGAPITPGIATKILRLFNSQLKPNKQHYGLTDRETEVLTHLVDGRSYKMIASVCGISYDTVRFHMKNIYGKLQVDSMTEAVSIALKQGLI